MPRCTIPVTGLGCASRLYTDLPVLDITPAGVLVREMAEGWTSRHYKHAPPRRSTGAARPR